MSGPLHSAATDDWGTPSWLVEIGREVMGSIDLDPASSAYWNASTVKARSFYDDEHNGLKAEWRGNLWLNPPGAPRRGIGLTVRSLVRPFWQRLTTHCFLPGESAVFVGYSLEQLAMLQSAAPCPLSYPTCILAKRVRYLRRTDGDPVEGAQPTHGSYLTLITRDRKRRERFAKLLKGHGHLVRCEP